MPIEGARRSVRWLVLHHLNPLLRRARRRLGPAAAAHPGGGGLAPEQVAGPAPAPRPLPAPGVAKGG